MYLSCIHRSLYMCFLCSPYQCFTYISLFFIKPEVRRIVLKTSSHLKSLLRILTRGWLSDTLAPRISFPRKVHIKTLCKPKRLASFLYGYFSKPLNNNFEAALQVLWHMVWDESSWFFTDSLLYHLPQLRLILRCQRIVAVFHFLKARMYRFWSTTYLHGELRMPCEVIESSGKYCI